MAITKRVVHGGMEILGGDIYVQGLFGILTGGNSQIGGTLQVIGAQRNFSTLQVDHKITGMADGIELNDNTSQMTFSHGIFRTVVGDLATVGNLMRFTDTEGLYLSGSFPRIGLGKQPVSTIDLVAPVAEDIFFRAHSAHPAIYNDFVIRHDLGVPFTTASYEIGVTSEGGDDMLTGLKFYQGGFGGPGGMDIFTFGLQVMSFNNDGRIFITRTAPTNNDANLNMVVSAPGGVGAEGPRFRLQNSYNGVTAGNAIGVIEFYKSDTSGLGARVVSRIKSVATDSGATYALEFETGQGFASGQDLRFKLTESVATFYGKTAGTMWIESAAGSSNIMLKAPATYSSYIAFREDNTTEVLIGYYATTGRLKIKQGSNLAAVAGIEMDAANDVYVVNLVGSGDRMVIADSTGKLSTQSIPGGTVYLYEKYAAVGTNWTETPANKASIIYAYVGSTLGGTGNQILYLDLDNCETSETNTVDIYVHLDSTVKASGGCLIYIRKGSNAVIIGKSTGGVGNYKKYYIKLMHRPAAVFGADWEILVDSDITSLNP